MCLQEEKWQCGTNVRAPFADDGELYEAIIERIFDDYAIVRYLGEILSNQYYRIIIRI